MGFAYNSWSPPSSLFPKYGSKNAKSKNASGENKGLGNGSKCERRIAKPTRSKSMNQISRNHKTGGLNFNYKIWAVSEGYFPHCFQLLWGQLVARLTGSHPPWHQMLVPTSQCPSLHGCCAPCPCPSYCCPACWQADPWQMGGEELESLV